MKEQKRTEIEMKKERWRDGGTHLSTYFPVTCHVYGFKKRDGGKGIKREEEGEEEEVVEGVNSRSCDGKRWRSV